MIPVYGSIEVQARRFVGHQRYRILGCDPLSDLFDLGENGEQQKAYDNADHTLKDVKRNAGCRGRETGGEGNAGKSSAGKRRNECFIQEVADDHDCFSRKSSEDDADGAGVSASEDMLELVEKQSGD